ncbi:DUF262 domain-containing protein [Promicromonospora sp. NPDC052451]|uniref:GmrSD restriction endonuclease domain-containing protein n=1 Tax=Promicromonospora sp. NPDC052451 TaxID=3364407 RepID=UPI0037C9ADE5
MTAEQPEEKTTHDPKPTSERITKLAERVLDGDIALPEFQRPFVWKRPQILQLLDSIYKNYPIGSLLVWESRQDLKSKRSIADLDVGPRSAEYPVNYLLDGQQRLSTICGALNWTPGEAKSVWNVYFNLATASFHHADSVEELPITQIPLRLLKSPSEFFSRTSAIETDGLQRRAKFLFDRFTDYQVPLVTLGDMSIRDVAPVFERINSTGTRLTIFDLMRAATWSTSFDLGKSLGSIKAGLEPKRFNSIEDKTLLRALAAAAGKDFSADSIDQLRDASEENLNEASTELGRASELAADFLSTEVGVPRAEALPYTNQFAVLAELFRALPQPNATQLAAIRHWFWRTTLSTYFAGWNNSQMATDARVVREFADGTRAELDHAWVVPTRTLWKNRPFRSNSAVSKMLGLMLGAAKPRDLISGQVIDVDKSLAWSNDKEFHHFFPQQFLSSTGRDVSEINAVANIVLLTSASNINISNKAPSQYLGEIIANVGRDKVVELLATCLVSEAALDAALVDDFDLFLEERSKTLHEHVQALCDWDDQVPKEVEASSGDSDSEDSLTD